MPKRKYNLTAGPSYLPESVLDEIAASLYEYKDTGVGIMEMTHRGPEYEAINAEVESLIRELLKVPNDYSVILTTGGASNQFSMVPMNLLSPGLVGNYLNTGVWADGAIQESYKFGKIHVAASSKEEGYRSIPKSFTLSENPAYLHYTCNNTAVGSQFKTEPKVPTAVPLVCDASSDIFSREIDISKYGLIYAGAQKNMGIAGITLVIIANSLLDRIPAGLPVLMDYRSHVKARSIYNTPPTFPVFVTNLLLKWLKREGGVSEMVKRAAVRASLIYDAIDGNPLIDPYITDLGDRSPVNITFNLKDKSREAELLQLSEDEGFVGIKGHRLVGGFRISMYNAFPLDGAKKLADLLSSFA